MFSLVPMYLRVLSLGIVSVVSQCMISVLPLSILWVLPRSCATSIPSVSLHTYKCENVKAAETCSVH